MKKEIKIFIGKILDEFDDFLDMVNAEPKKFKKLFNTILKDYKELEKEETKSKIKIKKSDEKIIYDTKRENLEDWGKVITFFSNIVFIDTQYHSLCNKLSEWYPSGEITYGFKVKLTATEPGQVMLGSLLQNLLYMKLKNKVTKKLIDEYLTNLYTENYRKIIEVILFYTLEGFELESKEIKLDKFTVIKKGEDSDFIEIEDFIDLRKTTEIILPRVLLKIKKKFKTWEEVSLLYHAILYSLRLYKFSNIYTIKEYLFTKSVVGIGRILQNDNEHPMILMKHYIIKNNDELRITNLFTNLLDYIGKKNSKNLPRSFIIALERFNWALSGNYNIDQRLLFVIMGLESLFIRDIDRSSQRAILSIRIPNLFKLLGWNVNKIRKNVKDAYNFRNQIAHGLEYDLNWKEKINGILPYMLNCLRISLLFFLYHKSMTKNVILGRMHESIFVETEKRNLDKMAADFVKEFNDCLEENVAGKTYSRENLVYNIKI